VTTPEPPFGPESVCAIVVTHDPSSNLYRNVASLAGQVAAVLIIDNGSSLEHALVLDQVRQHPSVEVIRFPVNAGIGAALNRGVQLALERRYPWVLTLDQDSRAPAGFVDTLLRAYTNHPSRRTIGLVAPRYREERLDMLHDDSQEHGAAVSTIIESTMMSGNLVRTDVIALVGYYDEGLFIDYVDHEFCLRMARRGFQVLQARAAVLDHNLGRMTRRSVLGITLTTTNHSPLRRYFNARNRIRVYREYAGAAPGWVMRDLWSFVVETAKILLLERERAGKLRAIFTGVVHGVSGGGRSRVFEPS
jgi:rhamnosyltransferase